MVGDIQLTCELKQFSGEGNLELRWEFRDLKVKAKISADGQVEMAVSGPRSLSAMYAFHAGLLWIASRNVRHYAALITYVALACVVFGTVVVWIDLRAGLPWLWIAGEGPFFIGVGFAMLVLQRSISPAREQDHTG